MIGNGFRDPWVCESLGVKIDEIDWKILKILLAESRTSFTTLAQECKITVTAVRMRYKRLWRDGVINGEKMLVNPHCLGYPYIADIGIATAVENEKEVKAFLEEKPYIGELIGPMGPYSFWGKVALRDLNKLHDIIEDLESNSNVKHVDALIWAEATNVEFPQNLMIKPHERESASRVPEQTLSIDSNREQVELDDIDRKIAIILSQNSRTPFKKMAKELKVSSKTVIQRYKKLRKNLLSRSTITVNLSKLGFAALGDVFIKVSNRSKMPKIYAQLLQIPNLIVLIRLMGMYDLYGAVLFEDFERLFEAYGKIVKISGVDRADLYLTPAPLSWPLNLFPSLIEGEYMRPKYWL